jgi:hypothetical protein
VFRSQRDRVLRHHRLSRRGMRRHKDAVAHLESVNCLFLEVVQGERVLRWSVVRRVGVWACGRVGVWACGRVGVWACRP